MLEALQLIAMYAVTLMMLFLCPRLLFVLMCLVAGYPVMAVLGLIVAFAKFVQNGG